MKLLHLLYSNLPHLPSFCFSFVKLGEFSMHCSVTWAYNYLLILCYGSVVDNSFFGVAKRGFTFAIIIGLGLIQVKKRNRKYQNRILSNYTLKCSQLLVIGKNISTERNDITGTTYNLEYCIKLCLS